MRATSNVQVRGVTQELTRMKATLHDVFGLEQLRPGQAEVMRSVLEGRNTLGIMPTGAGKSLCYQLPALHLTGTTIIISPLISLMKDQVDKLEEAGIEASQMNSALTAHEKDQNLSRIRADSTEFIFTTPERFTDQDFLRTLRKRQIDFIVIDEAHCISEWGHDFRPAYLSLGAAVKTLGMPPVLALTATATPEVIEDIEKQLDLGHLRVINTGIYRANLLYEVLRLTNEREKHEQLLRLLREQEGTTLIYASTVKTVDKLTEWLKGFEFPVEKYHGRMSAKERKQNQELFMSGQLKAIVATNAFGMGIDKPDIRSVIHYQMPGSLEAYYQESGRAGRDGETARCILFYNLQDIRTHQFFLGGKHPGFDDVLAVYNSLDSLRADEQPVPLAAVQEQTNSVAANKVRVILALLKEVKLVRELRGARFRLVGKNPGQKELEDIFRISEEKRAKDREKLEQMKLYGQSASCRWRLLHQYFDEDMKGERCGSCDNCRYPLEEQLRPVKDLNHVSQSAPVEREQHGSSPSPPSEAESQTHFSAGDTVEHPQFGPGVVHSLEDDKVLVRFRTGETRKFKKEFLSSRLR